MDNQDTLNSSDQISLKDIDDVKVKDFLYKLKIPKFFMDFWRGIFLRKEI